MSFYTNYIKMPLSDFKNIDPKYISLGAQALQCSERTTRRKSIQTSQDWPRQRCSSRGQENRLDGFFAGGKHQ